MSATCGKKTETEDWEKAFAEWKKALIIRDIETALPKVYAGLIKDVFKAAFNIGRKS